MKWYKYEPVGGFNPNHEPRFNMRNPFELKTKATKYSVSIFILLLKGDNLDQDA